MTLDGNWKLFIATAASTFPVLGGKIISRTMVAEGVRNVQIKHVFFIFKVESIKINGTSKDLLNNDQDRAT